jgi:hypothetical protein
MDYYGIQGPIPLLPSFPGGRAPCAVLVSTRCNGATRGEDRLARYLTTNWEATRQEIESLKQENHDLKQLVADRSPEVHHLKKSAIADVENTTT